MDERQEQHRRAGHFPGESIQLYGRVWPGSDRHPPHSEYQRNNQHKMGYSAEPVPEYSVRNAARHHHRKRSVRDDAVSTPRNPVANRRYNMAISMSARNLLNHTDPGPIIGNITSPLFGQANQMGGGGFGPGTGGAASGTPGLGGGPGGPGGPGGSGGNPGFGGFAENANNRRLEMQVRFTF
jgi:hypothetical protein